MDDVAHNRRVVKILYGIFRRLDSSKHDFSYSEMFFVLRVVQNLHLFDVAELLAHVCEESLSDVVVQSGERDLLRGHATDVTFVDLGEKKRTTRWG